MVARDEAFCHMVVECGVSGLKGSRGRGGGRLCAITSSRYSGLRGGGRRGGGGDSGRESGPSKVVPSL